MAGSKGIGFWIANALLRSGCSKVIITARNADTVANAVKKLNEIPNLKGHAVGIPSDVSDTAQIQRLVKKVDEETGGKVHILIANAASVYAEPFDTFDDKLVADTLNVNVRGIFNLTKWYCTLVHHVSWCFHLTCLSIG
jgi:NAD(P)-dependent dehydrogenase (short-subunit alcohol dehydrogenase family)